MHIYTPFHAYAVVVARLPKSLSRSEDPSSPPGSSGQPRRAWEAACDIITTKSNTATATDNTHTNSKGHSGN